ncbi:tumor necrosis factor receptor superfamily member 10B-like [Salvelinus namaycush]|uniref:Tumor necrosis factor receptor superfamily member 10B-like n=1 Tax=Salvelinus namaycush TaxID=8040 RepID=A0A8U0PLM6_SALNM|nr:tumor necrosis factor receptor superfamily member 10B-like [Salvelinus namaycush]
MIVAGVWSSVMIFDLTFMKCSVVVFLLCSGLACCGAELSGVLAAQWSGDDRNRTQRHKTCLENQQYLHQDLCCLNCQAGTFVGRACDRDMEQGRCLLCHHGHTYTEHSNGMNHCLPCTHCRKDQSKTVPCTRTTDTQCQCRAGTFCVPEQACEVCKRCTKCKVGEEEVKKCTPISNTLCRKLDVSPTLHLPTLPTPTPSPSSPKTIATPLVILLLLFLSIGIGVWLWIKKPCTFQPVCLSGSDSRCDSNEIVKIPIDESGPTAEERQNSQNAGLEEEEAEEVRPESRPLLQETQGRLIKASPPLSLGEDEDRGLGDSLPNTTSSSQTSLSALPTAGAASSSSSPRHSPSTQRLQPTAGDDPLQKRLVPLLGEETSLKKSFDLFDECLDVRIHNKFFRYIGVNDNHIKMAERAPPGDKVYDLLKNWMQKEGLKADINALLQALLSLDQRRSAESIALAAIKRGYYKHADTP